MSELVSVVAISENNVIATDDGIPWSYPVDKRQYMARIRGSPLLIGRKTYEAMVNYQTELLEASEMIVLTTNEDYSTDIPHHEVVTSKEDALDWVADQTETVYNIGGGQIYELFWDETDRLIVSHLPEVVENGSVFFPTIDDAVWTTIATEEFDNFTVKTYERLR